MSLSLIRIFPESGFKIPSIKFNNVDFPLPDSPAIPIISPALTLRDRFFKIV